MHLELLTTINKQRASNSSKARKYVDEFMCARYRPISPEYQDQALWYKDVLSMIDWHSIGGRWTGDLLPCRDDFWPALKDRGFVQTWGEKLREQGHNIPNMDDSLSEMEVLKLRSNDLRIQVVWEEIGGTGINPCADDSRASNGQEHDAMLVTKEIYERILTLYEGKNTFDRPYEFDKKTGGIKDWMPSFADLEDDVVSRAFIGNKWIVVVDCHF